MIKVLLEYCGALEKFLKNNLLTLFCFKLILKALLFLILTFFLPNCCAITKTLFYNIVPLYSAAALQIIMSTYQLAIVLLFNEMDKVTYSEMSSITHLKDKDLERNVTSLLDAKILKKVDEV